MKILLIALLLSAGTSVTENVEFTGSNPLSPESMASVRGAGFAGGAVCGVAMAGTAVGVMTIVGVLSGGATLPLSAAFLISSAAHAALLCTLV